MSEEQGVQSDPLGWFTTRKMTEDIYLTREMHFFEGNRANIWLVRGPAKDVVIDCGLGVCDLQQHLANRGLIQPSGERPCQVVCTHVHFDHSGGAHHFSDVYIHEEDLPGLLNGRQTETLNYVKPGHFYETPYPGFSACKYKVPPTQCHGLRDGDVIDLGGGDHLQVVHVPGHTKGSIALYYPNKAALFTGDFVYECGGGSNLLDWLPTSSVPEYVSSARRMLDWLSEHPVDVVYPGHFQTLSGTRVRALLSEYLATKENCCSRGCASCLQATTWLYFLIGCFRCCPC